MSGVFESLAPWLALTLMAGVAACALAAATSRSLVALCLSLWAGAALASAALLSLGRSDAALAFALLTAGLAPALLLAALLLSARVVKASKRRLPWVALIGAASIVGAVIWLLRDLPGEAAPAAPEGPTLFFIAPLLLAAVAAAIGLLGFGERGALEKFAEPADE